MDPAVKAVARTEVEREDRGGGDELGGRTYFFASIVVWVLWTAMDRVRAGRSRGSRSVIMWIRKEEPSGGGVDGSRLLGGREDGGGERG